MKILQVNKFYYPKGGAETYFLSLIDGLKNNGQEVLIFSQKNPNNLPSNQEKYFISDLNLEKFNWPMVGSLGRIFWSFSAARKIKKLIAQEKPDLVHIHNIYHQISPSILPAIKKMGLPIIMTVHDFKLIKHDYTLRADGKKIKNKNSNLVDLLLQIEFNFHKKINIYKNNVDLFLVASQFVKDQLVANGFNSEKIIIQPLFTDLEINQSNQATEKYFIAFGRLDESKGLDTLIRAAAIAKSQPKIKIVGNGPAKKDLIDLTWDLGIASRVEFTGQKNRQDLHKLVSNSLATIFPTRVHETFGLGALESMALGKPVIATKAGALPELVKDQENGILINVNNEEELAKAMDYLMDNSEKAIVMGKLGQDLAQKYSSKDHLNQILGIYDKIKNKLATDDSNISNLAKFS